MKFRVFQYAVPAPDDLADLNVFLAGIGWSQFGVRRHHVVAKPGGATLIFVVEYLDRGAVPLIDACSRVPGKGLPIGALTSQYLGNFILDAFDQRMKATGLVPRYLRYMDDIVLWAKPDLLPTLRSRAEDFLGELGLRMKRGGEWNRCDRGLPFLGFVVYPGRLRFSRQGRRRLRRKWTALEKARLAGRIGEGELQARSTALFACAQIGHDLNWRRAVVRFSRLGDAQEPAPCPPWRFLEQQGGQVPLVQPQQEQGR
jgi:hypothetical protein